MNQNYVSMVAKNLLMLWDLNVFLQSSQQTMTFITELVTYYLVSNVVFKSRV